MKIKRYRKIFGFYKEIREIANDWKDLRKGFEFLKTHNVESKTFVSSKVLSWVFKNIFNIIKSLNKFEMISDLKGEELNKWKRVYNSIFKKEEGNLLKFAEEINDLLNKAETFLNVPGSKNKREKLSAKTKQYEPEFRKEDWKTIRDKLLKLYGKVSNFIIILKKAYDVFREKPEIEIPDLIKNLKEYINDMKQGTNKQVRVNPNIMKAKQLLRMAKILAVLAN